MAGRLIYAMGPSGAGKDTLLAQMQQRLGQRAVLARRVVTRSQDHAEPGSLSVSHGQFRTLEQAGKFALAWQANGLSYGIDREIDVLLEQGCSVLVNGSRAYLPQAWARYPGMLAVLVHASADVLAVRLAARGRETAGQIRARLLRNQRMVCDWPGSPQALLTLDNSGDVHIAADTLFAWLDARLPVQPVATRRALCA